MIRSISYLSLLLLGSLGVTYIVHLQVFSLKGVSGFNDQVLGFYIMNLLMSLATGIGIIYLSLPKSEITGFVFMGGSLLKFASFFILFYGQLSTESEIRKIQFISFYVPYALSLAIEVWYLIRHLNKSD